MMSALTDPTDILVSIRCALNHTEVDHNTSLPDSELTILCDWIDRLRAERDALREAVRPFAEIEVSPDYTDGAKFKMIYVHDPAFAPISAGDLRRAAKALEG